MRNPLYPALFALSLAFVLQTPVAHAADCQDERRKFVTEVTCIPSDPSAAYDSVSLLYHAADDVQKDGAELIAVAKKGAEKTCYTDHKNRYDYYFDELKQRHISLGAEGHPAIEFFSASVTSEALGLKTGQYSCSYE